YLFVFIFFFSFFFRWVRSVRHRPIRGRGHPGWNLMHLLKLLKVFLNFFLCGDSVSAERLACDLRRPGAAQAFSDQAEFAIKKVDRLAHVMITAAAVLGECGIDLVGEPQWIVAVIFDHVAVIFDLGHWVVPDAQWSFVTSRRRPLNSGIGLGTGFEDFA